MSPLIRMWYMSLDTSAHCLVSTISVGAFDVLARAEGPPQRRGLRIWAEDGDSVMDVRRVPPHKLRHALGRTEETGRALDVAMRHAASGGSVQGHGSKDQSDEHLHIINKPLVADARGLKGVGDELGQVRVARLPEDQRTLDATNHVTLLSPLVGGETWPRG